MSNVKPKIIVICGPTASGKSDVAIKLAQEFNGEIISADSRQVYKGMDIGSGKVTRDESRIMNPAYDSTELIEVRQAGHELSENIYISEGILHYLIDVAEPNEDFNISHFKTLANVAIEEILAKGKLPIICGGTGFWIDAIVKNTNLPEVPPNPELRTQLEKKSNEELFAQLEKLDPERAKSIDSKNKVRLVRAIEICKKLGKVPKLEAWSMEHGANNAKYDFLQIGIATDRDKLNEKIKKRLAARFDECMLEEVKDLHASGVTWEKLEYFGLEYRWIARFLQNKVDMDEMKEKLYFDIIHYAKRQMTWFKKNKEIVWLENLNEIRNCTKKFLVENK